MLGKFQSSYILQNTVNVQTKHFEPLSKVIKYLQEKQKSTRLLLMCFSQIYTIIDLSSNQSWFIAEIMIFWWSYPESL